MWSIAKAAWWPDVGFSVYYIPGDFADTKKMNIIRLEGKPDRYELLATLAAAFVREAGPSVDRRLAPL